MKSFPKNRTLEIRTNCAEPMQGRIFHKVVGVPQGAILSPTLFNHIMRDSAEALEETPKSQYNMYADDITLWVEVTHTTLTREGIQRGLNTLNTHLPLTGMKPSRKTKYILIGGACTLGTGEGHTNSRRKSHLTLPQRLDTHSRSFNAR